MGAKSTRIRLVVYWCCEMISITYIVNTKEATYTIDSLGPRKPFGPPIDTVSSTDFNVRWVPYLCPLLVDSQTIPIPVRPCCLRGQGSCTRGIYGHVRKEITVANAASPKSGVPVLRLISCLKHLQLVLYFATNVSAHHQGRCTDPTFTATYN